MRRRAMCLLLLLPQHSPACTLILRCACMWHRQATATTNPQACGAHLQSTAKAGLAGRRRARAGPVLPSREEAAAAARVHGRRRCCVVGAGPCHGIVSQCIGLRPPERRAAPAARAAAAPAGAKGPKGPRCCCCCKGRVEAAAPHAPPAAAVAGPRHGRRLEAPLQAAARAHVAPMRQHAACSMAAISAFRHRYHSAKQHYGCAVRPANPALHRCAAPHVASPAARTCGGAPPGPVTRKAFFLPSSATTRSNSTSSPSFRLR